ncbi:hypothetical protein GV67_21700 [Pseudorhizobium pelagicum]|uniref:HTH luxR-type domain-containing protein n=1 Tax=Pseudorhizobium pelagicum TaxID=1509405 RepID=A0A922NYR4_9HYPH|nr:hypothetical protein GV68_12480 [Pseudorhizobium pelagicum]KEQ07393.1 hypothetical protein GV67_21700 [Pseudorhizobium pelagicum]
MELVMLETRRSLINSLQIASYVRDTADTGAAKSALTAVVRATAFVTDQDLRPLEANQAAVDAFRSGRPVSCRQGTVRFAQSSFTTRVLHLLRTSPADLAGKLLMRLGDEQWVVSVNQLPRTDGSGLIRGRRQFLIQIHKLAIESEDLDDGLLVSAYGLTPSEVRLCRALAAGAMLPDAAVLVQISYENARQKLKSIFRKVGVSSQADLKSLLRLIA